MLRKTKTEKLLQAREKLIEGDSKGKHVYLFLIDAELLRREEK